MQIYCYDIEGEPSWATGTAVSARDRRTARLVLLYRSLGESFDAQTRSATVIEQANRARHILSKLSPGSALPKPGSNPSLEIFTCKGFIALAAADAATAAPALEKLRAEGLFREAAPPPPPPPPPPILCSRCHAARPQANGICAGCDSTQKKAKTHEPVAAKKPGRLRRWVILALLATLIGAAAYYLWPTQQTTPTAVTPAPIVQFSASHTSVRKGSRVVLSWSTSGLSAVSITPGIGPVATSGKRTVVINHATTFSLLGTGEGYTSPATVTVSLIQPETAPMTTTDETSAVLVPVPAPESIRPVQPAPQPQYTPQAPPQTASEQYVRYALAAWAAAYKANDPTRQAALYAPHLERFFLRQEVDNSFVESYMKTFYGRGTSFVDFSYSSPEMTVMEDGSVKVMLMKHYVLRLANGEVRSVDARSELHFANVQGSWKITFERDFKG